MTKVKSSSLIPIIVVSAISVAIEGLLLRTGLWGDEATSYFESVLPHVGDIFSRIRFSEINPPLFFVLLHFWMQFVGSEDVALKLLPFIFSVISLRFVYLIGLEVADRAGALLVLAFVGANYTTAYYATELRPYALASLLCLLCTYAFLRWHRSSSIAWLFIASVSAVSFVYTTYIGPLYLLGLSLAILVVEPMWKRRLVAWAFVGLVPLVVSVPLLSLARLQASYNLYSQAPPLTHRPIALLVRACQVLPIAPPAARHGVVDACGAASLFILVAVCFYAARELRDGPNARAAAQYVCGASFLVVAACEAARALLASRYIVPVLPLGTIALGIGLLKGITHLQARGTIGPVSFRALIVASAAVPLLSSLSIMIVLANKPKSATAQIARVFPLAADSRLAIVVAPDTAAQTLAYYERTSSALFGFVRWAKPDQFDLRGYVNLWHGNAVAQGLKQIDELRRRGTERLVFVRIGTPGEPLKASGGFNYPQIDELVRKIDSRYQLVRTLEFPRAQQEPATAFEYRLAVRRGSK